jgi:hypothetical protein
MTRVYSGDIAGALGPHQETFFLVDYGTTVTDVACWKVCGCIDEGDNFTFCQRCFMSEEDHRNVMINPLQDTLKAHTIAGKFQITRINFEQFMVPWLERNRAYVGTYIHAIIPEDNGEIRYTVDWIEVLPQQPWFLKVLDDYRVLSQIGYFFQVRNSDVCEFQLEY